jgi:peptidyl-prolyl isomerase D
VVIADCGELPPGAALVAEVETAADGDAYADYPEDLAEPHTAARLVQVAADVKALGNKLFQAGEHAAAARKYAKVRTRMPLRQRWTVFLMCCGCGARRGRQALRYLDETPTDTPQLPAEQAGPLVVSCRLNRAACQLKLGHKQAVLDDTSAVLARADSKPADRGKAYYRRAQALVPGDYEAAVADLDEAIKLDPSDAGLRSLHATYRKELQARRDAQKKAYTKMFS